MRPLSLYLDRIPIVLQIMAIVSLVLVAVLAASLLTVSGVLTVAIRGTAGGHLESIAIDLADRLDDGLQERYHDITSLAASVPFTRLDGTHAGDTEHWIESLQDLNPFYAWVGLANPAGVVLEGSDDHLEGHSVEAHPWFAAATDGATLGDVREAGLLAELLRPNEARPGEPLHLLDVSAPVVTADGRIAGVLGAHLSWDWARDLRDSVLTNHRKETQTVLRVVDRDGRLLLGGPFGTDLSGLVSVRAALAGASGWMAEEFDGRPQLVGYAPSHGFAGHPGLGWVVLASTPTAVTEVPLTRLNWAMAGIGAVLALAGLLVAFLMAQRLGRPLTALTAVARGIGRDTPQTLPRLSGSREVVSLSLALRALLHRIGAVSERLADSQERNKALETQRQELERLAAIDSLTGLRNRRAFLELAEHEIARIRRAGGTLAVLMIDIDHFKRVNDTYGHAAGDEVIRAVADLIRTMSREMDVVSRFGGEEFVVLLPDGSFADARAFGERLRARIADHRLTYEGEELSVTVSVGCAQFAPAATGIEEAIDLADHALYVAKKSGRNRVETATGRGRIAGPQLRVP